MAAAAAFGDMPAFFAGMLALVTGASGVKAGDSTLKKRFVLSLG